MAEMNETDELLRQLEAAEAAERNPAPVERVLSDGTKITGASYDELLANVEAHFNAPKEVIQESPKPFLVPNQPPVAPPVPQAPVAKSPFDIEVWAQKLGKNPVEAQQMLDEYRFGADPVEKVKALEAQLQAQQQAFTRKTVRDWQRDNKDFDLKTYGTGADALLKANNLAITEESLDWVRDQFYANGWASKAAPTKVAPAAPPVAPQTATPVSKTGAGMDLLNELLAKINDPALTSDQRIALMEKAEMFSPGSESRLNSLGSR